MQRNPGRAGQLCLSLLVVALLAGATRPGPAQTAKLLTAPPEFTVDQWTTVDGLPQNSVNAIARTPDGSIWVGTFGGLARFDGLGFTLIERKDGGGSHVDRVLSLAVAPDSALWIGTENGLLRYLGGQFTQYTAADGLPDHEIAALHFDRLGKLWVGTVRGGAARYDGKRFVPVREASGISFSAVASFREDRDSVLWINSHGFFAGLEQGRPIGRPLVADRSYQHMVLQDREGAHWFRMRDGIARVGPRGVEQFRVGFGPEVVIEQQVAGRQWWATPENGVIEFRAEGGGQLTPYPLRDGGTAYGSRVLLDGGDGNVWAGTTRNGLLRLKRNVFTTYRTENGLSNDIITAVMEARDGSLWAGTNCGGVNVIDRSRRAVRAYAVGAPSGGQPTGCVFALAEDSANSVWVGTYGGGLFRFPGGQPRPSSRLEGLRDSVILALFTDRAGSVWVGTNAGGLAEVVDGRVRKVYSTADGLGHNSVRVITQSRDGSLWIGTLEGLSRLGRDGRITTYTARHGLSSAYVRSIYEEADGTVWLGTYGGGLNRLRDNKFTAITRDDGLADNVVSSMLEDGRGNLWMTGNRGIFRVRRQQLHDFADGKISRVHSVLYGVADGLVNAETNGGFQPAAWKDRSGRLWFPTIEGLASVDPAEAADVPAPPSVTIEDIVVDGESRPLTEVFKIGPGRPNVEFRYSGVSLSSPENVSFRYRLEGLDEGWVQSGTRRVAYYSRLPAGSYRFVVAAANRDGVWNSNATAMDVSVLAPLYQRPWFVAAVLTLILLVLWTAHRAILRTRTAAVHDERSRLAREIHDSLLQGFGGIALQLHAATARLPLSPADQSAMNRVLAMVDRTLTQARQAVWDIRPAGVAAAELHIECEDAVLRILGDAIPEKRVVALGRKRLLSMASQTECLRIVEEALTNIRKHADADHVLVELRYGWRRVRVSVKDDGKGFDPEREGKQPGHWGSLGMRERASRIGARLDVASSRGAGTIVRLDVPYRTSLFPRLAVSERKD